MLKDSMSSSLYTPSAYPGLVYEVKGWLVAKIQHLDQCKTETVSLVPSGNGASLTIDLASILIPLSHVITNLEGKLDLNLKMDGLSHY